MNVEFFDDPSGTREEIQAATYRALCEHGYAELTLETIGEEFDKSTSLIYHHYDSKDELLLACLSSMIDQLEASVAYDPEDPSGSIDALCDLLDPDLDRSECQFVSALVELRGQAPHHEGYREQLTRGDDVFETQLIELVQTGVDRGEFDVTDPEQTGKTLCTLLTGVMVRRTTTDNEDWMIDVREEIDAMLGTGK